MQRDLKLEAVVVAKYAAVAPVLDERSRRVWAAAESLAIGYGGDAIVSAATGWARVTVRKGRRELARGGPTGRAHSPPGRGTPEPAVASRLPGCPGGAGRSAHAR